MHFKKQISLFIAFFVLVSNSGLAFNVHYCQDKIASISSVFSKEEVCEMKPKLEEKTCCAKVEQTHKECCSDKQVILKSKVEKFISSKTLFPLETVLSNYTTFLIKNSTHNTIFYSKNNAFYCYANAPPFYQLYCQYTFYA